ncbi:o-methyltransferase [Orbilia oligospora]|uniref:Alpha N-terminal protein methyltransferase 1 n=1 Tax=Orbilia oligospora TaxID=2813651 RepID=A0A7C8JIX9_ORBOL|nr:o-methyltransferase [Orbilia oligospora]
MDAYNPLPPLTNVPRSPTPSNGEASGTNTPDYAAQIAYWTAIPSTVSGMLGGYPQVSRVDLQTSSNFLAKLKPSMGVPVDGVRRGVDCGAGENITYTMGTLEEWLGWGFLPLHNELHKFLNNLV